MVQLTNEMHLVHNYRHCFCFALLKTICYSNTCLPYNYKWKHSTCMVRSFFAKLWTMYNQGFVMYTICHYCTITHAVISPVK